MASVRSVVLKRPERVESAACLLPFSSCAAVVVGRLELFVSANRSVKGQRSRSTASPVSPTGKGDAGDAVLFLGATSLIQSVGRGHRLG